ncbi:hypothetical protein ACFLXQ_05875 [Chloroflexota bacterium]
MMKSGAKTSKLLVTIGLTLLILLAFGLSGFTIATMTPEGEIYLAAPNLGEETPDPVNVIKNGDFEEWEEENPLHGVALNWDYYKNGKALFGFYNETWPEAVLTGEHAQLLEINTVEANILDRVIAIHQTVGVQANNQYNLTLYAIMRSQAPTIDRNKNEFEMHWGVDYTGEGNYDNVQTWHLMPLEEQFRLGSTGEFPEDVPLHYEMITGTIHTTNTNKVTLFIRGLKKFPTGTEVNFDVDNVSLLGPPPGAPAPEPTPTPTLDPEATPEMPTSGAILSDNLSVGAVILGGLVLIVLGTMAAINLLKNYEEI